MLFVKNMEWTCEVVENEVTKIIGNLFPKGRICCLLRYGPRKTNNEQPPADYDFLLLLDKFRAHDYLQIRKLKEHNLPIEIFVDYKAHILLRGMGNYQRGCHGAYFVYILASAKTLLGTNFFTDKVQDVSLEEARRGLINRIEEYFYRIQKNILNGKSEYIGCITMKYISRVITDLLLLNGDIDFTEMHTCHYSHITASKLNDSNLFTTSERAMIQALFSISTPLIVQILPIIGILDAVFTKTIKTQHDQSI